MRLLIRAARRAKLPVKMTQGFSPHVKLSIKRALKLGLESENEEGSFCLYEEINPEDFRQRLQKQLPEGVKIKEAWLEKS